MALDKHGTSGMCKWNRAIHVIVHRVLKYETENQEKPAFPEKSETPPENELWL